MRFVHTIFIHFSNEIPRLLVYMGMGTRVPTCVRIWAPIYVTRLTKYWNFVICGSLANSKPSIFPRKYQPFAIPKVYVSSEFFVFARFYKQIWTATKTIPELSLPLALVANICFKTPVGIKLSHREVTDCALVPVGIKLSHRKPSSRSLPARPSKVPKTRFSRSAKTPAK